MREGLFIMFGISGEEIIILKLSSFDISVLESIKVKISFFDNVREDFAKMK
jgi:hypothetical protein